jgi:hypothetical protein
MHGIYTEAACIGYLGLYRFAAAFLNAILHFIASDMNSFWY